MNETGQSTPTTTMALDTFEARYAAFRSELRPREQGLFDEMICRARRHSNAINRRPHLDFERPVLLAMLMETLQEMDDMRLQIEKLQDQQEENCAALADAGLVVRRVPTPPPEQLGRVGQTRLPNDPVAHPLPA